MASVHLFLVQQYGKNLDANSNTKLWGSKLNGHRPLDGMLWLSVLLFAGSNLCSGYQAL